jgi:tartronate-semialdehyde synthase
VFRNAFQVMREGRPGPVHIDLPIDVQREVIEYDPEADGPLEVVKPKPNRGAVERALAMLLEAERPLLVAGGGVINAEASDLLLEFAELTNTPVVPTLMGWGSIPDDHPLHAGMVGLQTQHRYGNATFLASDFVLGIGNRWANRHTSSTKVYTRSRKFVHVDIEPTQIGRVFAPDIGIVADAREALSLFVRSPANGTVPAASGGATPRSPRSPNPSGRVEKDRLRQPPDQAATGVPGDQPGVRRQHPLRHRDRPRPDRIGPAAADHQTPELHHLRQAGPFGCLGARVFEPGGIAPTLSWPARSAPSAGCRYSSR